VRHGRAAVVTPFLQERLFFACNDGQGRIPPVEQGFGKLAERAVRHQDVGFSVMSLLAPVAFAGSFCSNKPY
jgi:hypothetical protein